MIKRNQQLFDDSIQRTFDFMYTKLPLGDIMEDAIDEAFVQDWSFQTDRRAEILAQYAELKPNETFIKFV